MPTKKKTAKTSPSVTRKEFQFSMGKIDQRFEQVDQRFEKVDQRFDRMQAEMDQKFEESKRHMGVLIENVHHKLDLILEGQDATRGKVGAHEDRIERLEEDVSLLKVVSAKH